MAESIISDSPEWFPLSPQEKQNVIDGDFATTIETDPEYLALDDPGKKQVRFGHQREVEAAAVKSQYNPIVQQGLVDQRDADQASAAGGLWDLGVDSHADTLDRATTFLDGSALATSKYLQKRAQKPQTEAKKSLGKVINKVIKATERDGYVNDFMAIAEFALVDLPQNISGIAEVAMESAASMTTHGMGAWGGAKLGALAAAPIPIPGARVAGATIGAAGGMIAASTADAGTQKYYERFETKLAEMGLAPTESNVQMLMDSEKFMSSTKKDSLIYGGTLGVVDALFGGLATRVAGMASKAARKTAMGTIGDVGEQALKRAAKGANLSVPDLKKMMINDSVVQEMGKRSFKKKLGSKVTSYVGEVAGEPASEAAATASIGEEIKAEDLIYETLGGIGAGPYGAAINTAAFGTKVATTATKDKAKKTVKAIMDSTPELRAEKKEARVIKTEGKVETKAAKAESRARANEAHGQYKKDVTDTDSNDETAVSNFSDPKSENYNPIKAVDILSKPDTKDAQDRIKAVRKEFKIGYLADVTRQNELTNQEIETKKALGLKDQAEFDALTNKIAEKAKTLASINKAFELARDKDDGTARDRVVKSIDPKTATGKEVVQSIKDGFGSSGPNKGLTNGDLDILEARGDLTKEEVTLVKAMREANIAKKNVAASALGRKGSIEEVSNDIYHGTSDSDFKGIDAYKQRIEHYLNAEVNDIENATKQLNSFKEFRDTHQLKAKRVAAFLKVAEANKDVAIETVLSKDQLTDYREMQEDNPNFRINASSGRFVNAIKYEAIALGKEVIAAEALFKADAAQKVPDTKVKVEVSTEATPVESAAVDAAPVRGDTKEVKARIIEDIDTSHAPAFAQVKEKAKALGAKWIVAATGIKNSFASRLGDNAKKRNRLLTDPSKVTPGDIVYVSIPGKSRGYKPNNKDYGLLPAILDAGAIIRTDTIEHANTPHNITGEGVIVNRLKELGYTYTEKGTGKGKYGEWTAKPTEEMDTQSNRMSKAEKITKERLLGIPKYTKEKLIKEHSRLVTLMDKFVGVSRSAVGFSYSEAKSKVSSAIFQELEAVESQLETTNVSFDSYRDMLGLRNYNNMAAEHNNSISRGKQNTDIRNEKNKRELQLTIIRHEGHLGIAKDDAKAGPKQAWKTQEDLDNTVKVVEKRLAKAKKAFTNFNPETFSRESIELIANTETWVEQGKPEVPVGHFQYGNKSMAEEAAEEIKTPAKATPRIVNKFVQTLIDQNTNDADLAKIEAKVRKKHGEAAGDYFREQVDAGKPKSTPVQEELDQVAGLARMLGVENDADPDHAGTIEEVKSSLTAVVGMLTSGIIDKKVLSKALSWLHTKGAELTQERNERATFKTYDHKTGRAFTLKELVAKKAKYNANIKRIGSPEQHLALQLAEELVELMVEHVTALPKSPENEIGLLELEVMKRSFKSVRFGPTTKVNDKGSPYHDKTNQQAVDMATAALQAEELAQTITETKASTVENNPDTVTDNLDNNLDTLPVTVGYEDNGQPITKPFNEVIKDKDAEIQEYQEILDCCKSQ